LLKYHYLNLKSVSIVALLILPLLFLFNNCGEKINSQMADSSLSMASTAPNGGPTNPYILQCLSSSDGSAVSFSLQKLVKADAGGSGSGKLSSFDWDQSIDILVTFDVECLVRTDFSDPIIGYVDISGVNRNRRVAALLVRKESVSNLQGFIKAALDSECIKSAEPNEEVKVAAVDPQFIQQHYLESPNVNTYAIGATDSLFSQIQSYVNDPAYSANSHIVKVAVIDTGIDATNPDLAPVLAKWVQTHQVPLLQRIF
jgi:hypothetical protein